MASDRISHRYPSALTCLRQTGQDGPFPFYCFNFATYRTVDCFGFFSSLTYIGIIHWEARVKKTDRSLGWVAVTISSGNGIVRVVWRSISRYFDSCLNWAGSCSSSLLIPLVACVFQSCVTMLWVAIRDDPLGFCVCMCIDFILSWHGLFGIRIWIWMLSMGLGF